jgi:hypothetical protein
MTSNPTDRPMTSRPTTTQPQPEHETTAQSSSSTQPTTNHGTAYPRIAIRRTSQVPQPDSQC